MKSFRKKSKQQKPHIDSTPLIDAAVSPGYSTISTDSNENNPEIEPKELTRSQSTSSSHQAGSPTLESEFFHSQKKEHSWITEARIQSAKEPLLDAEETHFNTVEISTDESWASGIWQSLVLAGLLLITPSIIFALVGCSVLRCCVIPNAGRSTRERNKVRYTFFLLLAGTVLSVFKDTTIITFILYLHFNLKSSCYEVVYPIAALVVLVLFAFTPIMVYEFTGVSFTYGNDDGKKLQKKPTKSKEKQIGTAFMNRKLSSIHEVTDLKNQIFLLNREIPRPLLLVLVILCLVVCGFRGFLYWILHSSNALNGTELSTNKNSTAGNMTAKNWSANALNDAIMGLSSVNTFVMSFSISIIFVHVILWCLVCLKLWRSVLKDICSENNVISQGVDGVAAWWRIYQVLGFLSSSPQNPFVLLRVALSLIFSTISIVLSATLISPEANNLSQRVSNSVIVFDVVLLMLALLLLILFSLAMASIKKKVSQEFQFLKLRMTQLIVSLSNESDKSEGEYQAYLKRFRARNIRSSLQLLQELSHVIDKSKSSSFPSFGDLFYMAVVVFGFVSIGIWKSRM